MNGLTLCDKALSADFVVNNDVFDEYTSIGSKNWLWTWWPLVVVPGRSQQSLSLACSILACSRKTLHESSVKIFVVAGLLARMQFRTQA